MKSRKIQWLALVIMVVMGACSSEPPTPPLSEMLVGTWQPNSYVEDPIQGWRDINESNGRIEVSITRNAIIITQFDRYDESTYNTHELEIASFENDTIRTGSWKTDPWRILSANQRLYRRDVTDNDNSVWIQCGMHHLVMEKIITD